MINNLGELFGVSLKMRAELSEQSAPARMRAGQEKAPDSPRG